MEDNPPIPPEPAVGADELLASLQQLSIASITTLPTSPAPQNTALFESISPSVPALTRKPSHLGGSLPNSPLKRQASNSALPTSSSPRPMSRNPSITSLPRSETPIPSTFAIIPEIAHPDAETLVILTDTSYLHRYSRPGVSKSELADIVERPERITSAALGVAAAVSKLEAKTLSVIKTERQGSLKDASVTRVHGTDYPAEIGRLCDESAEKLEAGVSELPEGYHAGDLYLCGDSRKDLEGCVGAVWEGVDKVFGDVKIKTEHNEDEIKFNKVKRAFVCIRPPGHHCAEDHPSGFCFLNNVHVAIARASQLYGLTHAVIFDFDLHHGDGSQAITWSLNDQRASHRNFPSIAYYSLHDIKSYPCELGDLENVRNASVCIENAHGQNIWNVHLESFDNHDHFWQLYNDKYSVILQKARSYLASAKASHRPHAKQSKFKAGIFISAGFDASEYESSNMQRHKVNVPTEFYARFSSDAVDLAEAHAEGRILSVLEGGYSARAIWTGVFSHLLGLAAPHQKSIAVKKEENAAGMTKSLHKERNQGSLAHSLTGKPFAIMTTDQKTYNQRSGNLSEYDPEWFSLSHIDELEKASVTAPPTRKVRDTSNTSFYSPTASSSAKASLVSPKLQRKSSTSLAEATLAQSTVARSPSPPPPPPPLEWPTASVLVWRSLLPDRQLASVNGIAAKLSAPKEPVVEKTRRVSKRHSAVGIPAVDSATMAAGRTLRDRKKPDASTGRGDNGLSSIGEAIPNRRASLASIRSTDMTETVATASVQTAPKRKVTPPRKPAVPKAPAAATSRTSRPSTGGTSVTSRDPIVKKPTTTARPATTKAATTRNPVTSRKPTALKTTASVSTGNKTNIEAVSPIESNQKSLKDVVENTGGLGIADGGTSTDVEDLTGSLKAIKITYKNYERDAAQAAAEAARKDKDLEDRLEQEIKKEAAEELRAMNDQTTAIPRDQTRQNSSQLLDDVSKDTQEVFQTSTPSLGTSDTMVKNSLPHFTASSKIPFGVSQPDAPRMLGNDSHIVDTHPAVSQLIPTVSHPQTVDTINGRSFRDRIAEMTPPRPKEKGEWQVGEEITPYRAYNPATNNILGTHNAALAENANDDNLRRVDEDLK